MSCCALKQGQTYSCYRWNLWFECMAGSSNIDTRFAVRFGKYQSHFSIKTVSYFSIISKFFVFIYQWFISTSIIYTKYKCGFYLWYDREDRFVLIKLIATILQ